MDTYTTLQGINKTDKCDQINNSVQYLTRLENVAHVVEW